MTQRTRFPVVFLLGVGHSGSTLLGRMLDMHSKVLCVGEMLRTGPALEKHVDCGCGRPLTECPFWASRLDLLRKSGEIDYRRFRPKHYRRLAESAGAEMVLDCSKTLTWRLARRWGDRGQGYLFLVRDSRGVHGAAARAGKDLSGPLRKHKKWLNRLERFVKKNEERSLRVFYEELCAEPERELRRIADFLGLEFEPALLRPADCEHHLVHSSVSPYLKASNEIRLDERWRRELEPETIQRIENVMAGIDVFKGRFEPVRG